MSMCRRCLLVVLTGAAMVAACAVEEAEPAGRAASCVDVVGRSFGPRTTCWWVRVPVDHDRPNDESFELAVVVTSGSATLASDDIGPVAFLAGGPGQASTNFVEQLGSFPFPLVFVDQRGTGHSSPSLDCPEIDASVEEMLLASSIEARRMETAALVACTERLVDDGVNLSAFTTSASADDIDVIGQALGFDRWNLWGGSYGAELAIEVMRRHPDRIRAAVVDSALPGGVDVVASWPNVRREKLDALYAACASDPACHDRFGDLDAVLNDLLGDLDRTPRTVDDVPGPNTNYSVVIDGDRALLATLIALGDTDAIAELPSLLTAASQGDVDGLARFLVPRSQHSFAEAMQWAVRCNDGWRDSDRSAAEQAVADEVGAYARVFSTGWIIDRCDQLPVDVGLEQVDDRSPVDIPALVMAGGFDPNQSADWVRRLADELDNATPLRVDWIGHTVGFTRCGLVTVESFLTDPTSPDLACDPDRQVRWKTTPP